MRLALTERCIESGTKSVELLEEAHSMNGDRLAVLRSDRVDSNGEGTAPDVYVAVAPFEEYDCCRKGCGWRNVEGDDRCCSCG